MLTDFAEIWWLVCNLTSQCWCRILLKSDIVCQSYGNVYSVIVFSWTRCIYVSMLIWRQTDTHKWTSSSSLKAPFQYVNSNCLIESTIGTSVCSLSNHMVSGHFSWSKPLISQKCSMCFLLRYYQRILHSKFRLAWQKWMIIEGRRWPRMVDNR